MCKFTTKYACEKEVYNLFKNTWDQTVVPQQMKFTSEVTPVRVIWVHSYYDENIGRNLDTQVWEYEFITSDDPNRVKEGYVMIADEGAGWLFTHNLFDEEAAQLLQEISATAIPEESTT